MWVKYLKLYFSLKLWSVFIAHHCCGYGEEGGSAAPWACPSTAPPGVLNNLEAQAESETLVRWRAAVEYELEKVGDGWVWGGGGGGGDTLNTALLLGGNTSRWLPFIDDRACVCVRFLDLICSAEQLLVSEL